MPVVPGSSRVEVAELMSVTPETVSRWVNGERQPAPRAVRLLGALVLESIEGRCSLMEYLRSVGSQRKPGFAERSVTIPLRVPSRAF